MAVIHLSLRADFPIIARQLGLGGSPLFRHMTQECCLIMTSSPDNRSTQETLSAYEYGVWVFLALAGGSGLGLVAYVLYILLQ